MSNDKNAWHILWQLSPSENRHEADRGRSREIVAKEGDRGRSWNTYIFSHRDVWNRLDSDTKLCSKFTNSKWHHKFAKHNMNASVCILPIHFQNFRWVFSSLPPLAASCPSLPLSVSCSVVWLHSCLLVLWISGSVDHLLHACSWLSAFSPCVAFWIYLPGFCPLVSLVAGVEWSGAIPAGTLLGLCFCICHPFSFLYFLS